MSACSLVHTLHYNRIATPDDSPPVPSTPPPVSYTPKSLTLVETTPSSSNGSTTTVNPSTPLSPIIPCFPPGVNCSRRDDLTGDAVRDRCRDMVYKALMKGLAEGKGDNSADSILYSLAVQSL